MEHIPKAITNEDADAAPRSAQRAGGRDSGGSHRLEKRTHLNTSKFKIILRNYGNGLAEIGWSFVGTVTPSKASKGLSVQRDDHELRAQRRAKSRIRQLILATNADHMLTLTYRENVTNFEQACADLSKFVRIVKRKLPGWQYIAVPEQQQRGAWHWHIAVCGRQDVDLLRSAWRRVVGEGNIDVSPPKGHGDKKALSLVRYLGKYLVKGFQDGNRELNGRRYRASLGIVIPETMLTLPRDQRGNVASFALQSLYDAAGNVGHVWESDQSVAGWACSWK